MEDKFAKIDLCKNKEVYNTTFKMLRLNSSGAGGLEGINAGK